MLHLNLSSACRLHVFSASPSLLIRPPPSLFVCAAKHSNEANVASGFVFQPLAEAQDHLLKLQTSATAFKSLARHHYSIACEESINYQIAFEFHLSYAYHAIFAHFDRDNVALLGFAKFFDGLCGKHRARAEQLMKYQNARGGKVDLQTITGPLHTDFEDEQRGDALHAMEYTLALTRNTYNSLLRVHEVANKEGDPHLQHFLEEEFLKPQVEYIKKLAEYVSQLRRVGEGHGVYHFDLVLQSQLQEKF